MDNIVNFTTFLRPFGIPMYFMAVWYGLGSIIFPVLVCLDQEKSGNPALQTIINIRQCTYFPGPRVRRKKKRKCIFCNYTN
jgi:hypothetical protein